ncbi:hypothetical protein PVK06_008906 [Gossypium arboreum]|uniref:Reverse transcriptase n=1 Tax=Gossypium arboreum TaxID=29729 RepID=A0ABR0QL51_GOSAR|nr:hypothetical protein PVK06_008906 [Gossypium arboreum]
MSEALAKFTESLKEWNKFVYGHTTTRKRKLFSQLTDLHLEKILWKQKVRYDWLNLGDYNIKFFHTRTLQRRKNNRITAIHNSSSEWIFDPEAIE